MWTNKNNSEQFSCRNCLLSALENPWIPVTFFFLVLFIYFIFYLKIGWLEWKNEWCNDNTEYAERRHLCRLIHWFSIKSAIISTSAVGMLLMTVVTTALVLMATKMKTMMIMSCNNWFFWLCFVSLLFAHLNVTCAFFWFKQLPSKKWKNSNYWYEYQSEHSVYNQVWKKKRKVWKWEEFGGAVASEWHLRTTDNQN